MDELIELFSLERVSKAGARFSPEKTVWFNAQYMHNMSNEKLAEILLPILHSHGVESCIFFAAKIAGLIKERASMTTELWDLCSFLFNAPAEYDAKVVEKFWKGENPKYVAEITESVLAPIAEFSAANIEAAIHCWIEANGCAMGQIMNSLRLCIIGTSKGPSLYDICEILGKDETLNRLRTAQQRLN